MPNIDLTNNGLGNTNVPGGGGNPSGMPGMMNQSGVNWDDMLASFGEHGQGGGGGGKGKSLSTKPGFWTGQGNGDQGNSAFFYTNPNGGLTGKGWSSMPTGSPSIPMGYGNQVPNNNFSFPTTGGGGQGGNFYNFPANGTNNGQIPYMSSLNPGGGIGQYNLGGGTSEQLHDIYGSFGNVLYNYLSTGAGYNPQVAGALINQMQPLEARGRNHVLDAFGDEGQRFSSTAAIGLGDFESQFAADEAGILAQEYDKSQNRYAELLGSLMNDTKDQHAASGFDFGSIIGAGFDIASMFI